MQETSLKAKQGCQSCRKQSERSPNNDGECVRVRKREQECYAKVELGDPQSALNQTSALVVPCFLPGRPATLGWRPNSQVPYPLERRLRISFGTSVRDNERRRRATVLAQVPSSSCLGLGPREGI